VCVCVCVCVCVKDTVSVRMQTCAYADTHRRRSQRAQKRPPGSQPLAITSLDAMADIDTDKDTGTFIYIYRERNAYA